MKLRVTLALLAICAVSGTTFPGSTAAASRVPTTRVLVKVRCSPGCTKFVGVYEARPRHIELSEGLGGVLTLHWSQWHMRSATGEGSAYAVLPGAKITAHVRVSLGVWANGEFLSMGIHFTHVRDHDPETGTVRPQRSRYEALWETFDEEGQPAWLPLHHGG